MNTHPYFGPGNIVIDTCSYSEAIWPDYGELGTITGAPGHGRGRAWRAMSLKRLPQTFGALVLDVLHLERSPVRSGRFSAPVATAQVMACDPRRV